MAIPLAALHSSPLSLTPRSSTSPESPAKRIVIDSEFPANAKVKTSARTAALTTAIAKVTAAKDISATDRSTILATLNADLAGMNTVEAKIAADTTVAAAAALTLLTVV